MVGSQEDKRAGASRSTAVANAPPRVSHYPPAAAAAAAPAAATAGMVEEEEEEEEEEDNSFPGLRAQVQRR